MKNENKVVLGSKSAWGLETALFFGGIAVLIIPVIGWIAGPIMMLMGVVGFFQNVANAGLKMEWLRGECPWCANIIAAPCVESHVVKCAHCQQRSVVRGTQFQKVG